MTSELPHFDPLDLEPAGTQAILMICRVAVVFAAVALIAIGVAWL